MGSAGHRANVLNPSFTHGGVGGAAADNQQFQGYVQNTRMYTELFMQAPSAAAPAPAAPAPAPATRTAPAPAGRTAPAPAAQRPAGTAPAPAAPAAAAEPTPVEVAVAAPRRPQSAAVDGTSVLVSRPRMDLAARHLLDESSAARASAHEMTATEPQPPTARGLEVAAAEDAEPGLFDGFFAFFGSLLG
jgi:hypothetical protein